MVRALRRERQPVYDIEVEGSGNFFAEGVLVHNCLVLDDMIKDAGMALSPLIRNAQYEFWQSTAKTRLEPGGAALIVMQRWHPDDLAGMVMQREGLFEQVGRGGWTPVIVPLRAEPIGNLHVPGRIGERPDPLGRKDGEMLLTRFDPEELEERERTTDEFWWNAQYLQKPSSRAGTLFKRESFRYFDELPNHYRLYKTGTTWIIDKSECMIVVTTDLAASMKEQADFFCLGIWAVTRNRDLLLLDTLHQKLEGPDQDSVLEGVWKLARPAFMAIDANSYQLTMVQRMKRKGMAIRPVPADRDKYSRATLVATRMNGEGLFLPAAPRAWKNPLIAQCANFPFDSHDDFVDMMGFAATIIEPGILGGSANIRVVG